MKQNYLKELMTALLLLCCTVADAADFEVDGIWYNILSSEDKTVEVTSGSIKYRGAVTIPASVTYNGEAYSVKSIGNYAFRRWHGLTSIVIPEGVTNIGEAAFYWCSGLTSITSHIAAENLFAPGNDAFRVIDKDACTLYVPAGAKSTYESTDVWKDFKNIVEMSFDGSDATAIESVENEQGEAVYYDLSGRRVQNPAKGIYIVNGRKVFIK